jgi:DNA (cytosine-5)-methyltransferase 1
VKTLGSLFAGIGGFDLGFERAGWKARWQVEINPILRACLGDRFPGAKQYGDIREITGDELERVDCITAGFPCQDISIAGGRKKGGKQGLSGERSCLFWQALRIIKKIKPAWIVFENVPGLLYIHAGKDFQEVIRSLAKCGYMGFGRVLNTVYFGVPQKRRRVFLAAGFRRYPSVDYLFDAAPMEAVSCSLGQEQNTRAEYAQPGYCLSAKGIRSRARSDLGGEIFIAEQERWHKMVERSRMSEIYGISGGLDEENLIQAYAAGNAVCPQIAEWIAGKLG